MNNVRNTYTNDLRTVGDLYDMTYEIKTKHKIYKYNIEGIKSGPRHNQSERQNLLRQIINKNPRILHTHVVKIAFDLSQMAKKTTEKELQRLEDEGLLQSIRLSASPNALRMWIIPIIEPSKNKELEKIFDMLMTEINESIFRMKKTYLMLSIDEKANMILLMLSSINNIQPAFLMMGKILDMDKRKKQFSELIDQVYNILMTDNEFPSVFPVICKLLVPVNEISLKNVYGFLIEMEKRYAVNKKSTN